MNKIKIIGAVFLAILFFSKINAQESNTADAPVVQEIEMKIDNIGNAQVNSKQKYNAAFWNITKQRIGSNTAIYKTFLQRSMPKYFLSNFEYKEETMERTNQISFNVSGMAAINQDGKWELELEGKNPDIMQLNDKEFVVKSTDVSNGFAMPQTQRLKLPSGTKNSKIVSDSFGNKLITYSVSNKSILDTIITGFAALLALYGLYILYIKNKATVKQPVLQSNT
jgi:hypothetical protein